MNAKLPIYMDHNATTPVDRRVFEAMRPYFTEIFGNAASRSHDFGRHALRAVDKAREQAAALIGAEPKEIIWTSGSTEANNLAIKGIAHRLADKGRHIITQLTEHKAVIDTCKRLEREGYEVTWLGVDRAGRIDPQALAAAIRPQTILVSIMWANNETGTIQPIREIGRICREKGVLFHTDATQAVGKMPIHVEMDEIDLLSFSGHKMYGPKGCGALYVRQKHPRVKLTAEMDGGGHERGFRSGTLNVPGIVGVGAACELAMQEIIHETPRLAALRHRLEKGLLSRLADISVNGDTANRLPHVTNLAFAGADGESLLMAMDDVAVSSGSACTSASIEPSFVLRAMGLPDGLARSSIRFSLGRSNTQAHVDYVIEKMTQIVLNLRELSGGIGIGPATG